MKPSASSIAAKLLPALLALAVTGPTGHLRGQDSGSDPRSDSAQPQVFEALRGTPANRHGYRFSVSPNEEWIVAMHSARSGRGQRVRVLHRRSEKTWDDEVTGWQLDGFPDCFSADSKRIVLAGRAAELSSSMRALEFRELPAGAAPACTFLGFPTKLLGGHGRGRRAWSRVPQPEGEFGTVAWSEDGTRYASLTEGQVETSFLRVAPPDRSYEVDFSAILDAEQKRLADAAAKLPPALAKSLMQEGAAAAVVRLAQLAVSPDRKCLAGVATVYRGPVGFAGRPYGVLIPLDHGGYVAHPFAKNVYGKVLWSSDSQAIYYYAQPQVGTGNGTVHRLAVVGMRIAPLTAPASPAVEVSRARRAAPSKHERERQKHERIKREHYAKLEALFSKPQTLVEVKSRWGFTKSGHAIELFGVGLRTREQIEQFERTLMNQFVGRPVQFVLPNEKDFLPRYIPSARTGVFGDTAKYPWPKAAGARYGVVPVLIYDDGLVNSRFGGGKALLRYERKTR